MKEYLLSVDKFEKPKVLEGNDAIFNLLRRLLLLNPGTIQTRPEMGVGIVTKWRYMDISDIPLLETEISKQITKYLPNFQGAEVKIVQGEESKVIDISITIDNTLYAFELNDKVLTIRDL